MTKEQYHHGDLKSELIQKGLALLSEEGYAGFSLRKVAKECGVSQTAPYRHFEDKDELIGAIMEQAMTAFNESLQQAVNKHPKDPRSQLKEMGAAYIRFFADNPEYLRLLFLSDMKLAGNEAIFDDEDHMCHGHPFATLFRTVRAYCAAYPDNGWGERELTLFCWGLVHGISVLMAREELPFGGDYERLVHSIMWNEKFL
jgi:AcrR family transcriptional regulator